MSHDSKKFIKMQMLALIVGIVFSLFAYTLKNIPVFVGTFTGIADLIFGSVILSLGANYKRFHVQLYLYMLIAVSVFTLLITGLAIFQITTAL